MLHLKTVLCFALLCISVSLISQSWITDIGPDQNALNISTNNFFTANFSEDLDQNSLSDSSIFVYGSLSGFHESILIYDPGSQFLSISPTPAFIPGELISIVFSANIKNTDGEAMLTPYTWMGRVKTVIASGDLVSQAPISTGSNPYSITTADFNNDGFLDLATANRGTNNISILENDGSGGFSSANTLSTGNLPEGITVADFNHDGLFDLATVNSGSNSISILTNHGSFLFTNTQTIFNVPTPHGIQNRDIDGDGDLDLLTANFGNGQIGIYSNDGSGNFEILTSANVGGFPERPLARDFDNDGDIDLASPNFTGAQMRFFNQIDPTDFSNAGSTSLGQNPHIPTAADLNGDGLVDAVVPNSNASNLSIIINNGAFDFSSSFANSTASPWSVIPFDADGDGDMDLAVSHYLNPNGQLTIWLNDGTGNFPVKETLNTGASPHQIVAGDFNNDGTMDLATCNENSNSISLFLNDLLDSDTEVFSNLEAALKIYPNPFKEQTNIQVELTEKAEAHIFITDILGRKIKTLVQGELLSGVYDWAWGTKRQKPGIYLLNIQIGQEILSKKLILID